ncbi:MAG: ATP-binding protein [Leptospirales bacterium]
MLTYITTAPNMKKISSIVIDYGKTLREWNISEDKIIDIELAMEEVLANIVAHGYENREVDLANDIEIQLKKYHDYVELMISDQGNFFDINTHEEPNLGSYIDSPINGGFGAALIKKVMSEVSCCRENGTNITILRKFI